MAHQYSQTLNPPKTLIIPKHPNPIPSFSSSKILKPNSRIFPKLSVSAMAAQAPPPLDALLNGARKQEVLDAIGTSMSNCLSETNLHLTVPGLQSKTKGKVRDVYDSGDYLVMVTTDQQSAFDRILASIPFKGQVLPDAPEDLVRELSWRYIFLYETITKSKFKMPSTEEPIHDRISRNVAQALSSLK